ncbi:Protein arginine N-methyltransferase 5 [Tetrabaena socialis]|uniref:Protein arginine N-methyltransferase 5 n=1 Tax=Tetrabaena socialis TaxID=47790 RepID=A0A2J8AAH1_9CHLO|nr:Protein arginine N-methyltransferase 5 [Tetrabaena socialis]|eukprot:PNH09519.1 Protein arginine N-methyltransferase 5 [Tetrabaena socialis]
MPLGKRTDYGDAKFAGAQVSFPEDVPRTVEASALCGFDFVVAPLVRDSWRPPAPAEPKNGQLPSPLNREDCLYINSSQWANQVVGQVSGWIQPDSPDPAVRQQSVAALRHQLGWAAHLGLQAVLLPAPHLPAASPNYAQVLYQDNLESQTYETFEKDTQKYDLYGEAVFRALCERHGGSAQPPAPASASTSGRDAAAAAAAADPSAAADPVNAGRRTVVLMVVGAGRGPLVRASMRAAERAGVPLRVYAVEKNPNAIVHIQQMLAAEGWTQQVAIVSADMRHWQPPRIVSPARTLGSLTTGDIRGAGVRARTRDVPSPGRGTLNSSDISGAAPGCLTRASPSTFALGRWPAPSVPHYQFNIATRVTAVKKPLTIGD